MSKAIDAVKNNKNVIQSTGGVIASIGLEQVGKKVAGTIITPATWAFNYAAEGGKPGAIDIGLYASGFINAPAAVVTGTVKALVDDDTQRKLELVRSKEGAYGRFIHPCSDYASSASQINAMTIASKGGVAWISSYGLWVYIKDAKNHLVADYKPAVFLQLYRPRQPLKASEKGRFHWEVLRK